MRPRTSRGTAPGGRRTVPRTTRPASTSGERARGAAPARGQGHQGLAGDRPVTISSCDAPGHARRRARRWTPPPGWPTGSRRRARAGAIDAVGSRRSPSRSTATRTRVRQPKPVTVALDRLDLDVPLHAGEMLQLLGDAEGLQPPLCRQAPRAGSRNRRIVPARHGGRAARPGPATVRAPRRHRPAGTSGSWR